MSLATADRSRPFMPSPLSKVVKGMFPQLRTRTATYPVWADSMAEPIRFTPLPRKKAVRLYHHARRFERQTRTTGHQDGAIGRNGLKVLESLIFDFLNFATGELFPSVASLAARAGISPRSVRRGLDKLKAAGVLDWQRRKDSVFALGRVLWFQKSNAYQIKAADQWRGFDPPLDEMPSPHPTAWGATPMLPAGLQRAFEMIEKREQTAPTLFAALEEDPTDSLAATLAKLGRAMGYGMKT